MIPQTSSDAVGPDIGKQPGNSADSSHLVKASISSASSLVALQLLSRLFTFALNQALFRLVSPEAFGTAAIQFELMLGTILFLSREGVRNTLLRAWPRESLRFTGKEESTASHNSPVSDEILAVTNLATLPLIIGLPLSTIVVCIYGCFASDATRNQSHFLLALYLYATAAIVELLSEPIHNRAMAEVRTGIRVKAEGFGITMKTILTFMVLLCDSQLSSFFGSRDVALLAFAIGQLVYSAGVMAMYVHHFGWPLLWPRRLVRPPFLVDGKRQSMWIRMISSFFDPAVFRLSLSMTSQSLVKHFLTEADKLIVSWFSPLQDQGGYALAVNYGSLVARVVFQPIEEICRVYFSRIFSTHQSLERLNKSALQEVSETITSLLAIQVAFSSILVTFGTLYLPIFLPILLPPRYMSTSAPQVLSAWIWYIPFLAVNGGLEAFLSSVASPKDLIRQSRFMVGFSIIYISSAILFYRLRCGDVSLVYANIVNLFSRIVYATFFTASYFRRNGGAGLLLWSVVIPHWGVLSSCVASFAIILCHEQYGGVHSVVQSAGRKAIVHRVVLVHVALGMGLGFLSVAVWWISTGRKLFRRRQKKE